MPKIDTSKLSTEEKKALVNQFVMMIGEEAGAEGLLRASKAADVCDVFLRVKTPVVAERMFATASLMADIAKDCPMGGKVGVMILATMAMHELKAIELSETPEGRKIIEDTLGMKF